MSGPRGRRQSWIAAGALGSLVAAAAWSPATAVPGAPAAPAAPAPVAAPVATAADPDAVDGEYRDRFLELYDEIKDPANGYFSAQGIPYHAVETLMVEAPDHGHETTSEAYSYWIELEAVHGYVTGEWEPLNEAWATMEQYMIPQAADQPTNAAYNPSSPATYASEYNHPSRYPSPLSSGVSVGRDPIAGELRSAYGTNDIYGMHWLADVDNVYGFGAAPGAGCTLGPDYEGTSYINTFQRGPQESVWETVPHPSCEEFEFGGPNGFLDLFTGDSSYAKQWKYTNAPDADARAIQAVYWAHQWASDQGKAAEIADTVAKAARMGDYLRYALFDKYFKTIGCTSPSCAAGSGKDSAHYLLSWYYAWGGAVDTSSAWAWRIGSSHAHFGYQNPMAAYALSTVPALQPDGATAVADWEASFDRQLEFYRWLQSADGGIAGGATNSWDGAYATPPAGTPTFHGMAYVEAPVYNDPSSNQWFGMQVWGMERIAELFYETGDERAEELLENWVPWVTANTTFSGADWRVPATLTWSGAPDTWNAANPGANANLRVSVRDHGQDIGVAGSLARTLIYWAAASGDEEAQANAKALLDSIWANNRDDKGVSAPEVREDYRRFDDVMTGSSGDGVYIPQGWSGTMPNGDVIEPGVSFLDIRSFYTDDPDWAKVQAYLDGGPAPEFRYHRFWAQAEIAKALADYDRMFGSGGGDPDDTQAPTAPGTPTASAVTATSATLTWGASTDDVGVTGYVVRSASGATLASSSTTSTGLTGLTADTSYTVRVVARDAAGNESAPSAAVTFRTSAGTGTDTQAPTAPGSPAASAVTASAATISWSASTDDVGVTGYEVRRSTGGSLGTTTGTSLALSGLTADTAYSVVVVARDAAGNVSPPSTTVTFRTLPDTPTGACTATLTIANAWPGGFQAAVEVKAGTAPITGWTTSFTLPAGAGVAHLWSGTPSVTGSAVTVTNAPWNGSLGAGATTTYGFVGSGTAPTAAVPVTCTTP